MTGVQTCALPISEHKIAKELKRKIALFCNVAPEAVIEARDASSIYEVPLLMDKEKLDEVVLKKLGVNETTSHNLDAWREFINRLNHPKNEIKIGLVGKYVELKDSYKSISEAFIHAGAQKECKVKLEWIHSESLTEEVIGEKFKGLKGILVAPGFGNRGIEGKILAIKYARENQIPFLGICLGMQCAVIEFARNVIGLSDAHSREMNPATSNPVIDILETQKSIVNMGGTMRLGAYACRLEEGTIARTVYGKSEIMERHRHRYEFNNEYKSKFTNAGMILSGMNPVADLVEIIELPNHPWFVGVQFHPEYKSTVTKPHPLFLGFVEAAMKR